MVREIECPVCGKRVAWTPESRWRPFCSERCKLIDLGDWAAERHVIRGAEGTESGEDEAPGTTPAPPSGNHRH
jgi:uncharacterized protein